MSPIYQKSSIFSGSNAHQVHCRLDKLIDDTVPLDKCIKNAASITGEVKMSENLITRLNDLLDRMER